MSKIAFSPNASGTGTFTVAAPNTNTDYTLTFPQSTGILLNDQSDIETQVKTTTNATGSAPMYSGRAWVQFTGTGTVTVNGEGNVSSITDNGTGNYTVNFTTAMPDANYAVGSSLSTPGGSSATAALTVTTYTTTSFLIISRNGSSGSFFDQELVSAIVLR